MADDHWLGEVAFSSSPPFGPAPAPIPAISVTSNVEQEQSIARTDLALAAGLIWSRRCRQPAFHMTEKQRVSKDIPHTQQCDHGRSSGEF